MAHEVNGEKFSDKEKSEEEAKKFREKLEISNNLRQPPEEVKNNIILDIDDILKKEEAL